MDIGIQCPGNTKINRVSFRVGSLVVDLVDAKTNELVWRAVASSTIPPDRKKLEKKIQKVVAKMFASYPPGTRCARGLSPVERLVEMPTKCVPMGR